MSDAKRYASFDEFWPYYLSEHSLPRTRMLHFAGTAAAIALFVLMLLTRKISLLPLVLIAGYGPAWIGHYFVEHNRPATFTYPTWSLIADFKMFFLWISGKLEAEIARLGITTKQIEQPPHE